jgi:type I restriction enzyme S subunit
MGPQSTGEFTYVDISSIDNHTKRIVEPKVLAVTHAPSRARQNLAPGDVLVSMTRPNQNSVAIVPAALSGAVGSTGFHVLRTSSVEPGWLFYLVQTTAFIEAMSSLVQGALYPAVRPKDIRSYRIPLAPLPEQRRIVAEIEKHFTRLDAAIASLQRARANLKRYRAAVLKAACEGRLVPTEAVLARAEGRDYEPAECLLAQAIPLVDRSKHTRRAGRLWGAGVVPDLTDEERQTLPAGWSWAKVRALGSDPEDTVQVGPMSMRSQDFAESGVPVLNVGCVRWGTFDETKLDFMPSHKALAFSRYRIQPGDVLFTRSGTVGRCAVARPHQADWLMTFHLLRARPDQAKCLPEYLRIVFEGAGHIRRQTREASIGTTRAGFNTNLLADLAVPLPPLPEQHRIVAEVERRLSVLDELEATVAANLKRAERLRQAVLKRAFEGKLVPQDPADEPGSALLDRIGAERDGAARTPSGRRGRRTISARDLEARGLRPLFEFP